MFFVKPSPGADSLGEEAIRLRSIFAIKAIVANVCACFWICPAIAQVPEPLPVWAQQKLHVPRRALVIGISAYDHATQLTTPPLDVTGIQKALAQLHFDSVDVIKPDHAVSRAELIAAIRAFAARIEPGALALIFYSGHGVQVDGANYLVPSEGVATPSLPGYEWLSIDYVLNTLQKTKAAVALLVLDACRANPFANTGTESRDILAVTGTPVVPIVDSGGLALASGAASPYVVAYAAQPMKPAYSRFANDPPATQSIYTRYLTVTLPAVTPLDRALSRVDVSVNDATHGIQFPTSSSSAVWDVPLDATIPDSPIVEEDWQLTTSITPIGPEIAALRNFLSDHPLSSYAPAARNHLALLTRLQAQGLTTDQPIASPSATGAPRVAATTPPVQTETLLGSLQSGKIEDGLATAVTNSGVMLRGKPNSGKKLGALTAGLKVRVVNLLHSYAQVIAPDGRYGWIGGIIKADEAKLRQTVNLGFGGNDEYAPVSDWKPLADAIVQIQAKSTAVTIRVGSGGVEGDAHSQFVARLRALRIRDYVAKLGATAERIIMIPNDPTVPKDQVRISVVKIS